MYCIDNNFFGILISKRLIRRGRYLAVEVNLYLSELYSLFCFLRSIEEINQKIPQSVYIERIEIRSAALHVKHATGCAASPYITIVQMYPLTKNQQDQITHEKVCYFNLRAKSWNFNWLLLMLVVTALYLICLQMTNVACNNFENFKKKLVIYYTIIHVDA